MRARRGAVVALAAVVALLAAAAPAPARAADDAWTKLGFAERSPSREGSGTLPGFPSNDPWFGHDKKLHFEISAGLAAWGYATGALLGELSPHAGERPPDRRVRFAIGATVALGAGVGKELWDLSGHGDPSFRDLTWDVIGTATGLAVAAAIDWTVSALLRPRALLRPQTMANP